MKLTTQNLMIQPALSGGAIIHFETTDLKYQRELMHKYDGKEVTVDIKVKRKGRSLDANAYCFLLCGKIAETKGLLVKKTDIYKQAVKDYGISYVLPIENELLGDIMRWHESGGLGNACDVIGKSRLGANDGCKSCIHCKKYANEQTGESILLCNKDESDGEAHMSRIPKSNRCEYWDSGYTNVLFYQGSSKYTREQFSVFLDGIVADAKELGIQTETPDEIARMKAEWRL